MSPKKAGVILYDRENHLMLLIRGNPTGKFSVPKGTIEKGETPTEAAFRELYEETGIDESTLIQHRHRKTLVINRIFYVICLVSIEKVQLGMPSTPDEVQTIGWYNPDEVVCEDCNHGLKAILKTDLKRTSV